MKNWFIYIALFSSTSSEVLAQDVLQEIMIDGWIIAPAVPEISSGLAPLAFGLVAGIFVLYHEWRKKK